MRRPCRRRRRAAARSTFHCSAARSSSSSRAAAAARRSWGAIAGVVRLPKVPASKGTRAVSAMTRRTDAGGSAQLLGDDLGQRRADVLADLDLAGVDGDRAVLGDVQPGADLAGRRPLAAAPPAPPDSCAAASRQQAEDDQPAAERRGRSRGGPARTARPARRAARTARARARARRRCGSFIGHLPSSPRRPGSIGGDDARVGAAAADVAVHAPRTISSRSSGRGSSPAGRRPP